ncbi:MAG: hypothetical protein IT204_04210 [Fimbriimonadaceae bacterium]|nr:hypothetical protein [Fimbriimonadaceae bacterium]
MPEGAVVGGIVALVGSLGLIAYLAVINQRLRQAVDEFRAPRPLAAGATVTVERVRVGEEQDAN